MTDPFAELKPLDLEALCALDLSDLAQPFDDIATDDAHPEVDVAVRLDGDRRLVTAARRQFMIDYRANPDAYKQLDPLPAAGESLQGIVSGKYALCELVPALIDTSGRKIDHLHLATLGFSQHDGEELIGLLDTGHIRKLTLICHAWFKGNSSHLYEAVVPQLAARDQRVLAMRSHCKMIAARMHDGTAYVVESSANLRSSVNVEQFVMTCDFSLAAGIHSKRH